MRIKLWSLLSVPLMVLSSSIAIITGTQPALASVTSVAWPTGLQLDSMALVSAHGNGALTLGTRSCNTTNVPTEVTISADHAHTYSIGNGTTSTHYCASQLVSGVDNSTYYVQRNTANDSQQIIGRSGDTLLWTYDVGNVPCYGFPAYFSVTDLAMGYDGNIYMSLMNTCSGQRTLQGLDAATGKQRFASAVQLTWITTGYMPKLLPYNGGIATVGDNDTVHYTAYDGSSDATTFAPTVPSGSSPVSAEITTLGRVYMATEAYSSVTHTHINYVYYRDLDGSNAGTVSYPSGYTPNPYYLFVTPANGVVLEWNDTSGGQYFGYFDSSGTLTYQQSFATNTSTLGIMVDSSGNVILQRTETLSNNDRNVIVESYNSVGVKTTLFDAVQQFGTSGIDTFVAMSASPDQHVMGGGQYYLVLCRHSTTSGSAVPPCNLSTDSPQILSIPVTGSDYPRSGVFGRISLTTNYVALGDSYSAGEGNPPFVSGTDNNGGNACDRSLNAYSVQLAEDTEMRLSAFRACSGATTSSVVAGMNGEPGQLGFLDDSTDVVTITIGGNDAYFADFAEECVLSTCDSDSLQYQNSMEVAWYVLPSSLDSLFSDIASHSPSADVYVVGYPKVAPASGVSCTFFSNSERTAADNIVDALNGDLADAVSSAGSHFHFVDPTASGSPFIGHEVCAATPYFFGLDIAEHRFSFHPNAAGVVAYEALIADAL